MKSSYIQLKMKDCNKLKQRKNITKKIKKEQNCLTLLIEE